MQHQGSEGCGLLPIPGYVCIPLRTLSTLSPRCQLLSSRCGTGQRQQAVCDVPLMYRRAPVADPGLSVRGGRIKQIQKGVGAGGGVAPYRSSSGVWGSAVSSPIGVWGEAPEAFQVSYH